MQLVKSVKRFQFLVQDTNAKHVRALIFVNIRNIILLQLKRIQMNS